MRPILDHLKEAKGAVFVSSFLQVITEPRDIESPWLEEMSDGSYRLTLWGYDDYIRASFRILPDRAVLYWLEWVHQDPFTVESD